MIDLVALQSLLALDALGTVGGAAASLGYTPSAVSQQIKRLESQAGVPLLERIGRGVVLTEPGRLLVAEGREVLARMESLESSLRTGAGGLAGTLRLAAFSTGVRGLVAPLAGDLARTAPGPRPRVVTEKDPGGRGRPRGLGRRSTSALVHSWVGVALPVPPHLCAEHVGEDVADLLVHRDHPLAGRDRVTPADLLDELWASTAPGTICHDWFTHMFAAHRRPPPGAVLVVGVRLPGPAGRGGRGGRPGPPPGPRPPARRRGRGPGPRPGAAARRPAAVARDDGREPRGAPPAHPARRGGRGASGVAAGHRPGDAVQDVGLGDDQESTDVRRSTRSRISAPASITSARPGCMNGSARRSSTVIATSWSIEGVRRRRTASTDWSITRRGRTPARSSTPAAIVVTVPATPTTVPPPPGRPRQRVEVPRRCRPTHAATSAAVGGSECRCRSCSRTDPMSIDGPRGGPSSSPRTSSVEPPPMSTTSTGVGRVAQVRARRRRRTSAASSAPATTSGVDPEPLARRPSTNTSAFAASRVAEVAQKRIRSGGTPCSRDQRGVLVDGGEGPRQRVVGEPAGAVDALAEPHHPQSRGPATVRASVADQQLDRVGAAVDRGDGRVMPAAPRSGSTQGPRPTTRRAASSTSSPSGLTPAALGQRLAGEHVQALDPVGHPAGGDPGDLGHVAGLRRPRAPRGSARAPRGTPRRGRGRSPSRSCISFIRPDALERADPRGGARAGQVEGRRERRAVGSRGSVVTTSGLPHGQRWPTAWIARGAPAELRPRRPRSSVGVDRSLARVDVVRAVDRGGPAAPARSAGCRPARPSPRPSVHHGVGVVRATVVGVGERSPAASSGLPSSSSTW